jgi:hypothetical protein
VGRNGGRPSVVSKIPKQKRGIRIPPSPPGCIFRALDLHRSSDGNNPVYKGLLRIFSPCKTMRVHGSANPIGPCRGYAERIVKRAQDGRKAARARGVQFGRKPKLTQHQQAEGRRRLEPEVPQGRSPEISTAITPSSRDCGWLRPEGILSDDDDHLRSRCADVGNTPTSGHDDWRSVGVRGVPLNRWQSPGMRGRGCRSSRIWGRTARCS